MPKALKPQSRVVASLQTGNCDERFGVDSAVFPSYHEPNARTFSSMVETSSGKTSLANVLTEFISNDDHIVVIENAAETQIHKDNALRFEPRPEQNGLVGVTIRDFLKATDVID